MKLLILCTEALFVFFVMLDHASIFTDCYDPLDPGGNITVTFDIRYWTDDGYMASVTLQNYYQYRHVEKPGWQLGWAWARQEIIWSMAGAVATHQGDCSEFKNRIPHSCLRDPVVVGVSEEAGAENLTSGCCRGGMLAASAIDRPNSFSAFDMFVGNLGGNSTVVKPENLTLLAPGPGYTCGALEDVKPTDVLVMDGKREEQVFRTWKSTCTYSRFVANTAPTCCVSLSAFYNSMITPCPDCSCGCSNSTKPTCIIEREMKLIRNSQDQEVACTNHECAIRVHWHVKSNYRNQWRVKVTLSNYRYGVNYSDWNLVVQHPSLSQPTRTYSFMSTRLSTVGDKDEAAIFWGLEYYNKELLQAGNEEPGSVTTEMLVDKDHDSFTLRNGWAFPRRVYFDGDECVMPMPDSYPGLPNSGSRLNVGYLLILVPFLVLFYLVL